MYLATKVRIEWGEDKVGWGGVKQGVAKSSCYRQSGNYNPHVAPSCPSWHRLCSRQNNIWARHSVSIHVIHLRLFARWIKTYVMLITVWLPVFIKLTYCIWYCVFVPVCGVCPCLCAHSRVCACVLYITVGHGLDMQGPESESPALISLILPLGT